MVGLMAAKNKGDLIPLCHPLGVDSVVVDLSPSGPDTLRIVATGSVTGRTGVEMEALTAASVAALTLYDMVKAVDKSATVTDIQVLAKSGGKSGDWERER